MAAVIVNVRAILRDVRLPEEMKSELEKLFLAHGNQIQAKGRVSTKALSIKTQKSRLLSVARTMRELREGGYALKTPYSLKDKHVGHLVERWVAAGKSAGTIENDLTYLRTVAEWMGKLDLVKSLREYPCAAHLRRVYVAERDKSWDGNGIDFESIIAEIERTDQHVAMALRLEAAFGIRAKESIMLRPGRVKDGDSHLPVFEGTKGGRPRLVRIEFEWQYVLLKRAAAISHPEFGSLIPIGYTVEQWKRHFYHVLEKHGVTGKELGVTAHGLRHQFSQALYKRLSGVDAAVKNSAERPESAVHAEASEVVVEAMGHSRVSKSNAYLSSFTYKRRMPPPSVEIAEEAVKNAGGNISKAAAALNISRQTLYRVLEKSKKGSAK